MGQNYIEPRGIRGGSNDQEPTVAASLAWERLFPDNMKFEEG
jgi:hypothetical protein